MHAEPAMTGQGDTTQMEADAAGQEAAARFFGGLMDVLMPAKPPEPKNARIVRQFDIEATKSDPQPETRAHARPATLEAAAAKRPQPEQRTRQEARAHRNRSLRAAAGFAD